MIEIAFNPKKLELKVKGHACYEEMGKDIVCAAVSILYFTLAECLTQSEHMLKKGSLSIEDSHGANTIKCIPLKEYEPNIQLMYWTCLNGMQLLADNYKDNVKLLVERLETD